MPTREDFVPMPYEKETQRFIRINGDQRKYFLFHEPELGKSHVLKVTETLCQIIPAGREMLFILQHPPSYALNMEKKIEYIPKKRIRRFFYEQYQKITGGDPYSYLIDFRDIRKQWEEVDYTNYAIKVRALPNSALHKSSKGHGGVVCF